MKKNKMNLYLCKCTVTAGMPILAKSAEEADVIARKIVRSRLDEHGFVHITGDTVYKIPHEDKGV